MATDESKAIPDDFDDKGYSLSGKIMLCAIIFLFFIVVLMFCLHIYARWYLLRARRRHLRRHRHRHRHRHRRHTQLIFYTESPTTAAAAAASRGLDASFIASLPVFTYDAKCLPENAAECAVCLSEFEPGETGRVLPKCNHSFHSECIDMWFHSHTTCPLCRAPVEPGPETQTRPDVFITVCGTEPGLGDENRTGREFCSSSSSVGLRRKPSFVGVTVDVPSRNEAFRIESSCDSPSTQSSFRSPMSRMLSFKRMIISSGERKGNDSPPSCGGGCSSATETRLGECGGIGDDSE